MDASSLLQRFASAKAKRGIWESHWQECYDYALPHGGGFGRSGNPGERKTDRLFDALLIQDALATLSAEHRAVVVAAYYRGRSVAEVASELGIPAGTVKSRMHYGLRALRLALQERGVTR